MVSQSLAIYRHISLIHSPLPPKNKVQNKAMDASTGCFVTSRPFKNAVNTTPPFKIRICSSMRKKCGQCLHRLAAAPSPSITIRSSLQSRLPEDDREPAMKSDWRSFRARLVVGEKASSTCSDRTDEEAAAPIQAALGEKWAHPLQEPERGCLLIATEKLDGVHIFERTVILLISTAPLGPTGVILNRPSLMSIKETKSTLFDVAGTFSDRPLYFGGPLDEGLFLVSPRNCDGVGSSGVFEEVMKGFYYGTKESVGCAAEMVKRNVVGVGDFRFFDGYCGWEKNQLREEIRGGYWNVVACSLSVIGMASAGLWEEVMGLVGEKKVW